MKLKELNTIILFRNLTNYPDTSNMNDIIYIIKTISLMQVPPPKKGYQQHLDHYENFLLAYNPGKTRKQHPYC